MVSRYVSSHQNLGLLRPAERVVAVLRKRLQEAVSGARRPLLPLPSVALLGLQLLVTIPVSAEVIPGVIQPGQLEKQLSVPPSPRSERLEIKMVPEKPVPPPEDSATPFKFTDIRFEGVTAYPEPILRSYFSGLIGKTITLNQLRAAIDNITTLYRNDGYVLAQALLPTQELKDGKLRIQVVEGYVAEVRLDGDDPHDSRGLIQDYADEIKASRPLRVKTLERYLLLLNDLPGITAYGSLAASTSQPGAADLIIRIYKRSFRAEAGLNNRLTELLGTYRGDVYGEASNLTGWQEKTYARVLQSLRDKMTILSVGEDLPLTSEGTKLQLLFNQVWSSSSIFNASDRDQLDSTLTALNLSVSHPFIRTRNLNLFAHTSLSSVDSRSQSQVLDLTLSSDRIRSFRAGATVDAADGFAGINLADVELSQGLGDGLGGHTLSPSGRLDYTKVTLYVSRLQALLPKLSLLAAFTGQYSGDRLLPPEQFAFGGEQFLRAYDPSEFIGDKGYALKAELRYNLDPFEFMSSTLYGFYDYGQVFNNGGVPIVHGSSVSSSFSAHAAGFGMRVSFSPGLSGYVEAAQPLFPQTAIDGNRHMRVFGGLRYSF